MIVAAVAEVSTELARFDALLIFNC